MGSTANGATKTYTVAGLTPGQLYDFQVSAVNFKGEGSLSSPAVEIMSATVATPPLALRKQLSSQTSITIQWDPPSSDGSTPITDYEVFWDNGAENGVFTQLAPSTGNLLTFTFSTGLVAGNKYSFKVRAKNHVGLSDFSNDAMVVAGLIPDKPLPPTKHSADTT